MRAYKVLLSVVLCLAMVLGMVGACAEAVSGKWTLRNVNIVINDESIVIGPEASLAAALEDEAVKLHIEAANGGKVLVPVSAELNKEGLLFTLDGGERVYSLDMETVFEMIGMSEEDMQAFEMIGRVIEWVQKLLEYQPTEEEYARFVAMEEGFYSAITGSAGRDVEVEVEGQKYGAKQYKGVMTMKNAIEALDFIRTCDVEIMAEYAQLILDVFNMSEGGNAQSYADWVQASMVSDDTDAVAEMEEIMNTAIADMEIVTGYDGSYSLVDMGMKMANEYGFTAELSMDGFALANYLDLSMNMDFVEDEVTLAAVQLDMKGTADAVDMNMYMDTDDGYGGTVNMAMEASATAEDTAVDMTIDKADSYYGMKDTIIVEYREDAEAAVMIMKQDSNYDAGYATDIAMTCNMTKTDGIISAFDADMSYDSGYSVVADGYEDTMATVIALTADGAKENGLWNMNLDIGMDNEYGYGLEGEAEIYTDSVEISGSYAEKAEEDGSITGAIALSAATADESYALSFEINAANSASLANLGGEGANVYALTTNTEDLAYTLLYADAMSLAADAMELAADEGIARLVTMITTSAMEYASDAYEMYDEYEDLDDYDYEDYEEEYIDKEEYYEEYPVEVEEVASLEEAAGVYAGKMPTFNVPAGYKADGISATAGDVDAYFVNGDKIFNLYVADFGMDMGAEGPTYTDDQEAGLTYVEFVNGSTYVLLIFELGFDRAEMEEIVSGVVM